MKKLYAMSLTICAIGLFILSNGIAFAEENVTEQVNDTAGQMSAFVTTLKFEPEPTDTVIEDVNTTETAQVTETTTVPTPGQTQKSPGFGSFITIVALVSMVYVLLRR